MRYRILNRALIVVSYITFGLVASCAQSPKEGTVEYTAATVTGSYKETREGPTTYTATFSGEPAAPPVEIKTIDIYDLPAKEPKK